MFIKLKEDALKSKVLDKGKGVMAEEVEVLMRGFLQLDEPSHLEFKGLKSLLQIKGVKKHDKKE